MRRGNVDDAERLKADMLAAAMELFKEGGVDAVSVRQVAAKVGIASMTPYRYFENKGAMLTGLWQHAMSSLLVALRMAVERERGWRAKHVALIAAFLDYWESHPDEFRLVYQTQGMLMGKDMKSAVGVPEYDAVLSLCHDVTTQLAKEIGASDRWVQIACDIRVAMKFGFLQASMVNRRFPWSDLALMRRAYVNQVAESVERVLLDGPGRKVRR